MIIITSKIINDDNNYIKNFLKKSLIINDDSNYIKNIKKDRWEYLDQKYSKKVEFFERIKC